MPAASTTGNVENAYRLASIMARTSAMDWLGVTVMGSWMSPWMWRFTRATSFTCSRAGML